MKRRIFSTLAALALCLSLLPATALAAANELVIPVGDNQLIMADGDALQVVNIETYERIRDAALDPNTTLVLTGNATNSAIVIGELPEGVSVTLRDLKIQHVDFSLGYAPFTVWTDGTVNVSIEGEVRLSSQMPPFAAGTPAAKTAVTVTGAGNLSLEKSPHIREMGALDVHDNASLAIELEGNLTITATGNDPAIETTNPITIRARNIAITESVSSSSPVTFIPSGKLTVNGVDRTPAAMVEDQYGVTTVDSLEEAFEAGGSIGITLLRDVTLAECINVTAAGSVELNLNGHTIISDNTAFSVSSHFWIHNRDMETWESAKTTGGIRAGGNAIEVSSEHGMLMLDGGTFSSTGDGCGVYVTDGMVHVADESVVIQKLSVISEWVRLAGGTYEGAPAIQTASGTLKELLNSNPSYNEYYAYFLNGKPLDLTTLQSQTQLNGPVTVKQCNHEGVSEYTSNHNGTHTVTCRACGYTGTAEKCGYTFKGNVGTCPGCKSTLTVSVSGVEELVYDATAKEATVSVTLDGRELTARSDYTVTYENNTNAGTAAVTVTGVSFNGSYTQRFAIAKATLTAEGSGVAKGTYGDSLSQLTVEGLTASLDGNPVSGTWKLSGDAVPNVGDSGTYPAAFTPAAGADNYKPLTAQVTLDIAKADYTGPKSAGTAAKFGAAATYDLTALLPEGAVAGTPSTASDIFAQAPAVSGKSLSYTLKAEAALNSTGVITVPVTSTNYKDFNLTITVTVTDKDVPALTVKPIVVPYTGEPVAAQGEASVDGEAVGGSWSFAGQAPVNVADSGVYQVIFTPADGERFAAASATVKVTITKQEVRLTLQAAPPSLSGGGVVTLTLSGLPEGGAATVTCDNGIAVASGEDGTWTATLPGGSKTYTFTAEYAGDANHTGHTAACTVKVGSSSSGNSGSSGGGGNSSYVPSAPSAGSKLPVSTGTTTQGGASATETTAVPTASVQGGTAAARVDAAMGQEIVKQAVENNSESVVIAPKITGSATRTEVSIPASTVGQLGSQTGASLTISTPVAGVTIPNGGLGSLSSAGGTVTVSAEMQGSTVELSVTANGRTVEYIPGGVTLTVPMDTTPGAVAVLVRPDGARETVRKSVARNGSVTIPLDGSARLVIVDNSRQFIDVPATSWAADAVAFASGHELFNGTGGGMFSPDAAMSRGMLAAVLYNLEGNPSQALTDVFADVDSGAWCAGAVAWAARNGIVSGYGSGLFGPNDPITREQLAVMLWRYAGSPAAANRELQFTDADEISAYALEALRWAVENGILNGYADGRLSPQGQATRAQAAQMLMNFLKNQ